MPADTTATVTHAAKKARRVLPPRMQAEHYNKLKVGDHVIHRDSGKVYQVTEAVGLAQGQQVAVKGRLFNMVDGKVEGPTRPLSNESLAEPVEAGLSTGKSTAADKVVDGPATTSKASKEGEVVQAAAQVAEKILSTTTSEELEEASKPDPAPAPEPEQQSPPAVPPTTEPTASPKVETPAEPKKARKAPAKTDTVEKIAKANPLTEGVQALYHLEGTDRYENLYTGHAQHRNANRKAKGDTTMWVQVSEDKLEEVQTDPAIKIMTPLTGTWDEWKARNREGLAQDNVNVPKLRERLAHAEGEKKSPVKDELKDKETEGKAPAKAQVKTSTLRLEWQGVGMCDLIRYGGAQGWDKKVIMAVAVKVGFKPSPTTIHIQSKKGKEGENVPKLDKSIANELASFAEAAGDPGEAGKHAAKDIVAADKSTGRAKLNEKKPERAKLKD